VVSAADGFQSVTFEKPIKGDLDRALSQLMHDARKALALEGNRIKSDATKAGALQSSRVIIMIAEAAEAQHKEAMKQATSILLDFSGRMGLPLAEITGWARPHLENLGNVLLGGIPPNGFPADHQRIRAQYDARFRQRLDGVLRDVEIGYLKGTGFAQLTTMDNKDEWISADGAVQLLKPVLRSDWQVHRTICKRAHDGLIRARAERFTVDDEARLEKNIPKEFWWAEGESALTQNWAVGDFETWIEHKNHWRAFGVSFHRGDVEKLILASASVSTTKGPPTSSRVIGMDEMEWALLGLKYLREARSSTHDELNDVMNEVREMAQTARAESWYATCKSILPTLYDYSDEFPGDGKIPGDTYASPQEFAVRLAEYRALVEQMRSHLDQEDAAYRKANGVDGPPFLVDVVRARVAYFLEAIEYVEKQRPSTLSTGLVNDLSLATRLATRFHEAVLALRKHPHGGTLFTIKDEWDCQYLFHSILATYFSDIRIEEWNPSVAGSSSRCEFFLKDQRLMIELKYVRKPEDQKVIKTALLTDFADYGANPDVEYVIALIYDPSHHLPAAVQLQKDLSGKSKGLERVQVIISPPRS
jgi:hypothetical protein